MEEIDAKVAAVVSSSEVAFNIGSDGGVGNGDTITIYRQVQVADPDTHEYLGSVHVPKLNLKVSLVQPKMCVAEVTDSTEDPSNNLNPLLSAWAGRKKVTTSVGERSTNVVVLKIGEEATIFIHPRANEPSGEG